MWGVQAAASELQAPTAPGKRKSSRDEEVRNRGEEEEGGGSCGGDDGGEDGSMNEEAGSCQLVASIVTAAASTGSNGGVLTVLGGKASCRRKFGVSVQLLDGRGRVLPRDLAIAASVVFAHDRSAVPPPADAATSEPPLFTTFNGVEFPAHDNPTRMVAGRASFKLALSLLSSKFDNRLFSVRFVPLTTPPICAPCFSCPIRSISRKRASSSASSSTMHSPVAPSPTLFHHPHHYQQHSPDHSSSDGPSRFCNSISNCRKRLHGGCGCDARAPPPSLCQLRALQEEEGEAEIANLGIAANNIDPLLLPAASTEHGIAIEQVAMPPAIRSPNSGFSLATATTTASRLQQQRQTTSPVGSCSPNSASESCTVDHHHFRGYLRNHSLVSLQQQYTNQVCHCGGSVAVAAAAANRRPLSAPSPPVSCAPAAVTRPLRPQASRLSPAAHVSFLTQTQGGSVDRGRVHNCNGGAGEDDVINARGSGVKVQQAAGGLSLMGALHHLSRAMAMAAAVQPKRGEEDERHGKKRRRCRAAGESAMVANRARSSEVEEQERAIQFLEMSLEEVSRELQKRKEEVMRARRHLIQQPSSRAEEEDGEEEGGEEGGGAIFLSSSSSWLNNNTHETTALFLQK